MSALTVTRSWPAALVESGSVKLKLRPMAAPGARAPSSAVLNGTVPLKSETLRDVLTMETWSHHRPEAAPEPLLVFCQSTYNAEPESRLVGSSRRPVTCRSG